MCSQQGYWLPRMDRKNKMGSQTTILTLEILLRCKTVIRIVNHRVNSQSLTHELFGHIMKEKGKKISQTSSDFLPFFDSSRRRLKVGRNHSKVYKHRRRLLYSPHQFLWLNNSFVQKESSEYD